MCGKARVMLWSYIETERRDENNYSEYDDRNHSTDENDGTESYPSRP